jgi:hypothetical protein
MLKKGTIGLSAIVIIVCIHAVVSTAESITIPSDKNIPDVPKELKDFVYSGQAKDSKSVTYSSGNRADSKIQYMQVPESPVITKSITPMEDKYYPGDIVGFFVEIKNNGIDLNKIYIKESVDEGLEIVNISKNAYVLDNLDEISNYRTKLNKNYYSDINDSALNCSIKIDQDDLLNIKMNCGDYLFNCNDTESNHENIARFLKANFALN